MSTDSPQLSLKRWLAIHLSLSVLFALVVVFFSFWGEPRLGIDVLFSQPGELSHDLFWHARLPRVLLAALVGAGLSMSGVAFQSLLRNPLADPYILGVSGGAALGGVLSLALGLSFHWASLVAFGSALGSLFLIYSIAQVDGRLPSHTLLLTGVIFNAFSFALILMINSLVDVGQIHQILYLLMGSLEAFNYQTIFWVALFTAIGGGVLIAQSSKMNLVSLGEEQARFLGLDVDRYRKIIFVAASLMVGASVAIAGLIGFVGLFVPHMLRLIFGPDHRLLVPVSALGGGIFLVVCDYFAKTLFASNQFQTQLPVGVITALIGGPFFVYLLKRKQ